MCIPGHAELARREGRFTQELLVMYALERCQAGDQQVGVNLGAAKSR
jgi:hypothetical protein